MSSERLLAFTSPVRLQPTTTTAAARMTAVLRQTSTAAARRVATIRAARTVGCDSPETMCEIETTVGECGALSSAQTYGIHAYTATRTAVAPPSAHTLIRRRSAQIAVAAKTTGLR